MVAWSPWSSWMAWMASSPSSPSWSSLSWKIDGWGWTKVLREIRYSQLIRNSNICAEVSASSSANGMAGYSSKSQYFLSVIYDNYDDDIEDYSRLLLKQNQGTCIPKRNILLEDDSYAYLRTSDIKELKSDIAVQKHRSLPRFATIQDQISSTDFKPLSRCLSENNILRFKRFSPSSFETNWNKWR